MHESIILVLLSSTVIISYLFNLVSKATSIPSVLLLIATGVGIKYATAWYGVAQPDVSKLVKVLGTAGLIMIVLEAAMDLNLSRKKLKLIGDSFASGLIISLASALGIAILVMQWLNVDFSNAFIYAVPLSIISSAIVIPSTSHLPEEKREFIIYESSFSDIFGILVFNYMASDEGASMGSAFRFGGGIGLAIVGSVVASLLLIYLLSKITIRIKFFLVFAVLSLLYALGEMIHLPALLIVMVFGLVINNASLVIRGRLRHWVGAAGDYALVETMKSVTAETSFLIRTFFFILFGLTINLEVLILPDVWKIGSLIILILLGVRYFYLRMILKSNLFPELFLMPRGLVTILLFYSIPASHSIGGFNEGILFFVVVVSSVLMMLGLLFFKDNKRTYLEGSEEVI